MKMLGTVHEAIMLMKTMPEQLKGSPDCAIPRTFVEVFEIGDNSKKVSLVSK